MNTTLLFKAFSDQTRLRCLLLLAGVEELCVCDLGELLELPQPKISHHLGNLRKAELVEDRKEGLWVYYRINPQLPEWIDQLLTSTAEGVAKTEPFQTDLQALQKLLTQPDNRCPSA